MIWDEEKLKNEIIGDCILTKLSWNYSVEWWGDIYSYSSADFGKMKWNENIYFDVMRGICEVKNAVISASKGANCRTCNKTSSIEFKVFSNAILIFQHFLDYKINCEKKTKYFFKGIFPSIISTIHFVNNLIIFPSSILSKPINFQRIFHRSSSVKRRRRKANFFSCCQLSHASIIHLQQCKRNKVSSDPKTSRKKDFRRIFPSEKVDNEKFKSGCTTGGSFPWRAVKLKNKFHKY